MRRREGEHRFEGFTEDSMGIESHPLPLRRRNIEREINPIVAKDFMELSGYPRSSPTWDML